MRYARFALWLLFSCLFLATESQADYQHFRTEKVNDHLYAFIGPDPTQELVDGNSYAIIGDSGVFVVDAHNQLSVARANIEAIRRLTDKPVQYLLFTHWHWDHNFGAPAYRKQFPGIHIIAQQQTRDILARRCPQKLEKLRAGQMQAFIDEGRQLLKAGKNEDSTVMTPADRRRNEEMMADVEAYVADTAGMACEAPDTTFDKELIVNLGSLDVQVRHDFRANTPGDAYVWLPQDSILITGDIVVSPIPYCFGSFFEEWVQQLDSFIAYHPRTILPGHGEIMSDTMYLYTLRTAFASLISQVKDGLAAGDTTGAAMKKHVDLERFRPILAGDDPDKNWAFDNYFVQPAIPRVMKELRGQLVNDPGN